MILINRINHDRFIYLCAALASLVLSSWITFNQDIINPDAICYLLSAETFGNQDLHAAMNLCGQAKWPFYSVLIHSFVKLSHFSYANAAYLIDALFSLLSVTVFISIVKFLGGTRRILIFAAMVILLAHQFNSAREYIIRDHGFWAFYLLSLLFLLQFFQKPALWKAVAWNVSLVCATLFRIEGAFFLLLLPHVTWFYHTYSLKLRIKYFAQLVLPMAVTAFFLWQFSHHATTDTGRLVEVKQQLQHGISQMMAHFDFAKTKLWQQVLGKDAAPVAGLVLALTLVSWYVISVMGNVSWVYGVLFFYALRKKVLSHSSTASLVLYAYLFINVLITFSFLLERFFLSKRYLIALSLTMMIYVPFALDKMCTALPNIRYRVALYIMSFLILISSLGGIFDFGYSKSYIREAGEWLTANLHHDTALYVNDYQLMYYSQHFGKQIFDTNALIPLNAIAHGRWKQYDYLALRLSKKNDEEALQILQELHTAPIQVFSNNRGDMVAIFETHKHE